MNRTLVSAVALAALAGPAGAQSAETVEFTSCPIYRDTDAGRKSGCWLADDPATGVRYDVTRAPTKPDWNYKILVEGLLDETRDDVCGGVVLNPIRVSILAEPCPRHMLPAEGYPGLEFILPQRNVRPLYEERTPPEPPFEDRTFHLFFDFDKDFIVYQLDDYLLDKAVTWLKAAEPRKITVTGYAATQPYAVSGQTLRETPEIAQQRAETIAEALRRLGIDADKIELRTRKNPEPVEAEGADGLPESSRRRVEIHAEM